MTFDVTSCYHLDTRVCDMIQSSDRCLVVREDRVGSYSADVSLYPLGNRESCMCGLPMRITDAYGARVIRGSSFVPYATVMPFLLFGG